MEETVHKSVAWVFHSLSLSKHMETLRWSEKRYLVWCNQNGTFWSSAQTKTNTASNCKHSTATEGDVVVEADLERLGNLSGKILGKDNWKFEVV